MGLHKRCNPMAESQNNWVVDNWVEDLQSHLVGCVFESMWHFWLIWRRVVWFCSAAFEMYDLHTDCPSGKKIGKLHYFLKGRKYIFLVCGTQIFGGINNMWFQSMFWLRFLFVFQILLKWGQCTVNANRLDIFQGQILPGHWKNFTGALKKRMQLSQNAEIWFSKP